MAKGQIVDLEYDTFIHETDKAGLFVVGGKEVWIPKSMYEVDLDTKTVSVPYYFAHKEGLI